MTGGELKQESGALTQAFSIEAIFGQALAALHAGQPQEAVLTLQGALTDAVHNQGYSSFQHLAQAATAMLPRDAWLGCAGLYAAALADEAQPAALLEQAAAWTTQARAAIIAHQSPSAAARRLTPSGKPKLAYLVSQPHHHALLSAVVASHDPSEVEVHVFADKAWPALPAHVQLHALSAQDLAGICQAQQIDVVIDTGGLQPFAGQFPVIEALVSRIAPVQVGWLGCLASSGGVFDVLLADDVSLPPEHEVHFSERVVRLTGGQWCWSPPLSAPAVVAAPYIARGHVTLGVVGRGLRLGPQFLTTLAAVMAGDPTLRVCFIGKVCGDQGQRLNIGAMLSGRGVATDRTSFAPWTTREGYWHWLATVDVVFDTCPASGGLSLLDALWMGVPVVTCHGASLGSRQAASVLTAIGLDRWVAKDPGHMVQRTLGLIHYAPNFQASRFAMRERIQHSRLLNGKRVARQIEKMVNTEMKALRQ